MRDIRSKEIRRSEEQHRDDRDRLKERTPADKLAPNYQRNLIRFDEKNFR
jgi:hypothetical protein